VKPYKHRRLRDRRLPLSDKAERPDLDPAVGALAAKWGLDVVGHCSGFPADVGREPRGEAGRRYAPRERSAPNACQAARAAGRAGKELDGNTVKPKLGASPLRQAGRTAPAMARLLTCWRTAKDQKGLHLAGGLGPPGAPKTGPSRAVGRVGQRPGSSKMSGSAGSSSSALRTGKRGPLASPTSCRRVRRLCRSATASSHRRNRPGRTTGTSSQRQRRRGRESGVGGSSRRRRSSDRVRSAVVDEQALAVATVQVVVATRWCRRASRLTARPHWRKDATSGKTAAPANQDVRMWSRRA